MRRSSDDQARQKPGRQGTRIRNHLPSQGLLSCNWENNHGTKIFEESIGQGRTRDEKAQGRNSEERSIRSQGQEPQTGDRDRSFRGEGGRQEGPEEDFEEKEELQEAEVEKIVNSKLIFVMAGLDPAIHVFFLLRADQGECRWAALLVKRRHTSHGRRRA
jgi:hypothetical protein